MSAFALMLASCVSASCFNDLPPGAELFTPQNIDSPMTVETAGYKFSLGDYSTGKIINGVSSDEKKIRHILNDAGFDNLEKLFLLESHGCDSSSIDLVIQIGPGKNSDIITRSYYRIIFSSDLKKVVAEFYDPSVSALNAVLPIQTVEGIPDPKTGQKIVCRGSTPSVIKSKKIS